jgi:hypothetical protein
MMASNICGKQARRHAGLMATWQAVIPARNQTGLLARLPAVRIAGNTPDKPARQHESLPSCLVAGSMLSLHVGRKSMQLAGMIADHQHCKLS